MIRTLKHFLRLIGVYRYITDAYDYSIETYTFIHVIRLLNSKKHHTNIFLFFSNYATGGAEKVHLQITEAIKDQKPIVFFTERSFNSHYRVAFEENASIIEIHLLIRKHKHFLFRRFLKALLGLIHASENPKLFGCNSPFYYQLIPLLNENVACFDLFHSLVHEHEIGPEKWSLPVVERIQKRVVISKKVQNDLCLFYKKMNLGEHLNNRIVVISNAIAIPEVFTEKNYDNNINVIFLGRPDPVKRIHLIGRIAKALSDNKNIHFNLVGPDLEACIEEAHRQYFSFSGSITDHEKLNTIYKQSHILIMTSEREGLPMVIMEAMGHGVIPISTNVGAVSELIQDGVTGKLIHSTSPDAIVTEATSIILSLVNDQNELKQLSHNAYLHAKASFSKEKFTYLYQNLLQ